MTWFFNYFPLCLCSRTLLREKEFQRENRRLVLIVHQGRYFKYPFWLPVPLQDSNLISVPVETLTWPVISQLFTWGFCWLIFNEYFIWGILLLFRPPIQNWPCVSYTHTARAHGPCSPQQAAILRNKAGLSQNSWGFPLVRPTVISSVSTKPFFLHLAGNGPFLQVLSGFLWTAGIYCRNLEAVTALGHQTPHALHQQWH